jgi:hypothetical protein
MGVVRGGGHWIGRGDAGFHALGSVGKEFQCMICGASLHGGYISRYEGMKIQYSVLMAGQGNLIWPLETEGLLV